LSDFRLMDRDTFYLFPPSVNDWLPPQHMARFVVEVIDGLDLSAFSKCYRRTGSAPYHPALLLGILIYGYATGVFSSRKLERATYDSVAFRFIAANEHPDHDTIATFRRRFLPQIEALFVEVLLLAREMKLLKLGTVALDGDQDPRQRQPTQRAVLRPCRQDRGAAESGSGRADGEGRSDGPVEPA
jgi:transposase